MIIRAVITPPSGLAEAVLSRPRRVPATVLVIVVIVLLWRFGPTLLLGIDEGALPTVAQARALPRDAEIVELDRYCGSGGCSRLLSLSWPGHTDDELRAELRIGGDPPRERCEPASIMDQRRVCLSEDVIATPAPGEALRLWEYWKPSGR